MDLDTHIEDFFKRLLPVQKKALKKLGLETIQDLLYHFPSKYISTADIKNISELKKGDNAILYGKISGLKTSKAYYKKIPMAEAVLEDDTGKIKIIWFRQPYIAKMLHNNSFVKLDGKVAERQGKLYITNPEVQHLDNLPIKGDESLFKEDPSTKLGARMYSHPSYPESRGITSKWFHHAINKIFKEDFIDSSVDPIPKRILKKYNLPSLKSALIFIHTPKKESDALVARKRFAFEEVFYIQLQKQKQKQEYKLEPSFKIDKPKKDVDEFVNRFPFTATKAQNRAIKEILKDFKTEHAMSRLLEGDVGSGKTAVAATTAYSVVTTSPGPSYAKATEGKQDFGNLQVAYMVPTEILAKQHFESFIEYFEHLHINIGLITSSGCKKFPSKVSYQKYTDISRAQLLKWVANGEIAILIGTHSLISKAVKFENLAYVIIDEQHRFGVNQRKKLTQKTGTMPHLLSMTATPIPRTLALTIYGDLDLTLLDEMPAGRKQIITELIPSRNRKKIYDEIRERINEGRQMYVICARIDEPDPDKFMSLNVKSVKEEAKRLKKEVFPEFEIEILHSKITPRKKEEIMQRFVNKEIDILVSTSVIEVGVNVPNATTIIIEGAERFGLAQLHQLRGRVLRSNHQAYCYIFTDKKSGTSFDRLNALKMAKNGFELAEKDLMLRGSGQLVGGKQWGISDIGMEAIKNLKMVEAARTEARELIEKDSELKKYPLLKERVKKKFSEIHFE